MALTSIATAADLDVGSSANDGTGNTLRAAAQAIETGWSAIDANFDNLSQSQGVEIDGVANSSVSKYVLIAGSTRVLGVAAMAPGSAPSSALGAVTLAVEAGGNTLLDAATADLESLSGSEALDVLGLTATSANLDFASPTICKITVGSDNADATNLDGIQVFLVTRTI